MPLTTHITHSPEETRAAAAALAARLRPGAVLALHGDLGAG
jgi:tRNA A37 threonylcarbamoyladenosine biosynthesis protein TsaE